MAGDASRKNGMKGGRPKGSLSNHTLNAQEARAYLIEKVRENIGPLFDALFKKAQAGDVSAIKELFDRAFGKSPQAITGAEGGALKVIFDQVFNKDAPTSISEENSSE